MEAISKKADSLILYYSSGPDYDEHFKRAFSEEAEARLERAIEVDNLLPELKKTYPWHTAQGFIEDLQARGAVDRLRMRINNSLLLRLVLYQNYFGA